MADTDTVNVGCTHPLGMRLGVYEWVGEGDARILVPAGTIDIAGNGGGPEVFTSVPADLWGKWLELNKDSDLVKSGEVFYGGQGSSSVAGPEPVAEAEPQAAPAPKPLRKLRKLLKSVMGAIAAFSYPTFTARYPEFAGIDPGLASLYFTEATFYLRNDGSGPVQDAGQQLLLLLMLTAHIAKINALNPDGSSASGFVGPITSAAEGSVSVGGGIAAGSAVEAFFAQTQHGLSFWTATAPYRSFRYAPSRRAYGGYGGYGRIF